MIDIVFFQNYKFYDKINRFVNKQLSEIVRTFIDILDDNNGFEIDYFIYLHNLRIDNEEWENKVHDLYQILISRSTRKYIKPYYEYLLFLILEWYLDCNSDEYTFLHPTIPKDLKTAINNADDISEDEKTCIADYITDLNQYNEFVFTDRDFLPDNVANMTMLYLDNRDMYDAIFRDINLDDYYLLMPRDIQDLYNVNISPQLNTPSR